MTDLNVRRGGDPGFSDRDIVQLLLDQHKLAISCLAKGAIEASSPSLRQGIINSLNTHLKHQRDIWEVMNRKGWYQPAMAQTQDVSRVRDFATSVQQQVF
jgi:spore coat protein CotF